MLLLWSLLLWIQFLFEVNKVVFKRTFDLADANSDLNACKKSKTECAQEQRTDTDKSKVEVQATQNSLIVAKKSQAHKIDCYSQSLKHISLNKPQIFANKIK